MKCPHCLENFHENWVALRPTGVSDRDAFWTVKHAKCPACERNIFQLLQNPKSSNIINEIMVYPKSFSRSPLADNVPKEFAEDYNESCLVLVDSPKASAALSRRCLQNILREKAEIKKKGKTLKVNKGNLSDEIQQVIDSGGLPTYLSKSLDAVRNIGNFAAHPIKSKSTGEIVKVESGEAEWNLDVLESLFDFYFVQPKLLRDRREKLNEKLQESGKPSMK